MRSMGSVRVAAVAVAALASISIAACGGGSKSTSTPSAGPTTSTQSSSSTATSSSSASAATKTTSSSSASSSGGSSSGVSLKAGMKVFESAGCAGCHTLAAAGSSGTVGPNLDQLKPSDAVVTHQVINGGGGMPAFRNVLSQTQIKAVALYVSSVAGKPVKGK